MSSVLDNMERMVREEAGIRDADRIKRILERILAIRVFELPDVRPTITCLTNDIARGFSLIPDKVKKCTIKELLILIGYEPAASYFNFPDEDVIRYDKWAKKQECTAYHCVLLARLLLEAARTNPVVADFMRINYKDLYSYLSGRISIWSEKYTGRGCRRSAMRLEMLRRRGEMFVFEYDEDKVGKELIVGDVISTLHRAGTNGWACGAIELEIFLRRVFSAYRCMNELFMESLRLMLIFSGRDEFRSILERCNFDGTYDADFYDELEFDECYE